MQKRISRNIHLPTDGVVMHIHDRPLRGLLASRSCVREPLTEDDPERDVVPTATPFELTGRRLIRGCRAAALRTDAGAAGL